MDAKELRAALEAILFVAGEPVKLDDLAESFPEAGRDAVAAQLDEIRKTLDENVGGFMLEQTAGGWRFATRAEHNEVLKKYFAKKGENRLSIAALETLAIIAYRQPVTAPEISDIRGVNSTAVIRTLLERRMIRVAGRKNVVGAPFLYRTTKDFLVHFGLNDIRDLPRLEEFGDLIGEAMNDDLVAAIASAPPTPASEVQELTAEERDRAEADALAELDAAAHDGAATTSPDVRASEEHGAESRDNVKDDVEDDRREEAASSRDDANEESENDRSEVESPRSDHQE
jgi:segregation and condensation protein B